MLNRPKDLWGLLQTISPGRFGSETDGFFRYALRYCDAHKVEIEAIHKTVWDFSGISHEAELRARLSWLMLRRQLSDPEVRLDLPPKTRNIIWLEGNKKPKRFSLTNRQELRAALDASADAKLPAVIETLINDGWETPRVVFCWRKSIVAAIAESYRAAGAPSVEVITGDVAPKEREKRIARARSGILVVTIDSCGVAIDLSHAPYADFVEFVHEPWKFIQAEARVHRFGQQAKTVVRYFAQAGSADELIIENVVGKLEAIGAIVGSSDEEKSLQKKLSGEGFSEESVLESIFAGVE
jgi:SNF2 family DNA or RNA helicase